MAGYWCPLFGYELLNLLTFHFLPSEKSGIQLLYINSLLPQAIKPRKTYTKLLHGYKNSMKAITAPLCISKQYTETVLLKAQLSQTLGIY